MEPVVRLACGVSADLLVRREPVASATGNAAWNSTNSRTGSSRVRNTGATGVYWLGAIPLK